MALVISKVARLGGFSEFMRAEAFKISSAGFADLIVAYLFFPVLCVAIMYALKLMSPAPAWRDVELELKKNGFIREMSGDGDFILFKKEKDILRGRVGLRGNPTRLEWFKSGHFKQMINLRAE